MKKEDISGFLVYLIILAFAIVFGITVLQSYASKSGLNQVTYVFYVLGAIVAGVVINAVLFELGHMLGAKIGGYKILSVNIIGFMFYLKDGKRKFKFSGYDGLTGETKIIPGERADKKECNPMHYLLFGTIIFAVIFIAEMIVFFALKDQPGTPANIAYFILIMAVVGMMILVYNIAPLKLDSMTDGYRLTLLKNPKNKEAFNELLRVEYEISQGKKDVDVKVFTEITNFTAELNLNKVYIHLDKAEYDQARELLEIILKGKEGVSNKVYIRAKAQLIYIELMSKPVEDVKEFYDKEVPPDERREISEDVSMASIRAYMLMSGLLDKSQSETILALNRVLKAFKKTSKDRQPIELKLYNEALNKIIEAHPKWDLNGYLLTEDKD